MKFNIDDYKGKYVMHCKTEKEARDFCEYLDKIGRCWCSGKSYLHHTNWLDYQSDTVYYFNMGTYGSKLRLGYENVTILEWSDFMNKVLTKEDLKTGDIIKLRGGELGIVITQFQVIACQNGGWLSFNDIREDLTNSFYREKYDIMTVRRPTRDCDCAFDAIHHDRGIIVYERKEVEEMTLAEVCKILGKEIKIVK